MTKTGDLDRCMHCHRRISFGPYYIQKGVTVKRWTHKEGIRSCLSKPEGWQGEWPKATPLVAGEG